MTEAGRKHRKSAREHAVLSPNSETLLKGLGILAEALNYGWRERRYADLVAASLDYVESRSEPEKDPKLGLRYSTVSINVPCAICDGYAETGDYEIVTPNGDVVCDECARQHAPELVIACHYLGDVQPHDDENYPGSNPDEWRVELGLSGQESE